MHFICSAAAVRTKYGSAADKLLGLVEALGNVVDVSAGTPVRIQERVARLPSNDAICLVGGYDIVPPFVRPNPTAHLSHDDDEYIPTDAPYGATPGNQAEEYAPARAVSRIPDGATADAESFASILSHQHSTPTTATPAGSFQAAAEEFSGALGYVGRSIPGANGTGVLSPPETQDQPGLTGKIAGHGRIHILFHGANYDPDWAYLWGHDGAPGSPFIKALSARILDLCDLRGSMVTFSSCYAAMLDVAPAMSGARTTANQVALACLAHGAKAVVAPTRSNWIGVQTPFDAFGPRLVAETWKQLATGTPAAEALRKAKHEYLRTAISDKPDRPYAMKTVLQAQCYGHPGAAL